MGNKNYVLSQKLHIEQFKLAIINTTQRSLVISIVLLFWELAPRFGLADPLFIPPPTAIMTALFKLIQSGELIEMTAISIRRAATGYSLAVSLAVPLGFLVGWFKTFEKYFNLLFQSMRQINTSTILPLFIMLLGIGETSKIAIIAFSSFWSTFLNTVSGVKNVDPLFIKCARSIKLSNRRIFWKVVLPAAIPTIFTGLRYSASIALILLVTSEMLGGSNGLGYAINNWQLLFQPDKMWAGIVTMALIGITVNSVFVRFEKRLTYWKEDSTIE
jgi:NitT/TauT family transport system permease protein